MNCNWREGVSRRTIMNSSWSLEWTWLLFMFRDLSCIAVASRYFLINCCWQKCVKAFLLPLLWAKPVGKCSTNKRSSWTRRTFCLPSSPPLLPPQRTWPLLSRSHKRGYRDNCQPSFQVPDLVLLIHSYLGFVTRRFKSLRLCYAILSSTQRSALVKSCRSKKSWVRKIS